MAYEPRLVVGFFDWLRRVDWELYDKCMKRWDKPLEKDITEIPGVKPLFIKWRLLGQPGVK